jgi:hypothetical protein
MAMLSSTNSTTRNQRKTSRKVPRGSVKVECRHGGASASRAAQFLDISEGGLRIAVDEPIAEDKIEITITGPNLTRPVKRFANVVWSLPLKGGSYCVGLEFQKRLSFGEFLRIAVQTESLRGPQIEPQFEIVVGCP